ncbi:MULTISPECIES: IclR family transcriptional regulator C-terminal domain-containing protein [unclassified Chelatococcus]|uniref:IclR family transcriptional regulator n=1 Tax=unclassified Chelatococcus TaxID=2638111 RepID=UPI001BD0BD9D|nr:IclR family transcriptional regulator C-terminal domain-containing protein [Chelatococcus sp.]MBS7700319.1 helix-turn-helix domain-containing protein [Chelatococcus sp. YT9]MBX3556115.1 helix-turn-helix domain-containing protein [Chelatococcus sp.]
MSKNMSEGEDPDFIKSLAKGLAVIEAFGPDSPSMTLSAVAQKVGLSPGSTRRVLMTLSKLGYMTYDEKDRRFHLSARTLQLGYSYLASLPAFSLIQPRLAELSDRLNESCSVMTRDGREVVCIARATAKRLQRDYMSVGTRFPAHASSSGKLLLGDLPPDDFEALYDGTKPLAAVTPFTVADLPRLKKQMEEARRQGWIYTCQETALGMASLAVPIRVGGRVRYGLSTSATLTYDGPTIVDRYLPDLLKAAEAMERFLETRS